MTTTTKGQLFKQIAIKSNASVYPVVIALGAYFVVIAGGFEGEAVRHLVTGVIIAVIISLPLVLYYQYRRISIVVDNFDDKKRDIRNTKISILHLPWHGGCTSIALWILGASITLIYLSTQVDLTSMNVISFPLMAMVLALIHFTISYFSTENGIMKLLSQDEIRDTWLNKGDFKGLSFIKRILMLVISVVAIPCVVFGYLLYLVSSQKLVMSNIALHIGFFLLLSAATIIIVIFYMIINIKETINTLKKALEDVKDGRLDIPGVPMITSSEIGMISQSANALLIKLREVIQKVEGSSE